ncbi:hypothetical protein [Bdellovibrio sp. HCB209]|uniref:hypothetical protein n=1 Tax=Bdellovibrio sp. HCB209 TaxID=3394354 RepID=UPI0039B67DCE
MVITDFLIDNSALNEVLKNQDLTKKALEAIQKSPSRLFISIDSFTEGISGTELDSIINRTKNLHWLLENSNRAQIVMTKPIGNWLQKELRNHGRFENVPLLYTEQRWPSFVKSLNDPEYFRYIYEKSKEDRDLIASRTEALKENDRNFRVAAKATLSQKEVREDIENINLTPPAHKLDSFRKIFKLSNKEIKRILFTQDRTKYRIHRTYFMLFYLRMLGNAYSKFSGTDDISFLNRLVNGNWYDLAIMVQASQFNYFVTNDKDQRAMCNFLHKKGLIRAQGITLDEFFEKITLA